jgi:hypothetical protein
MGGVCRTLETEKCMQNLSEEPEGTRPFETPSRRWQGIVKADPRIWNMRLLDSTECGWSLVLGSC